MPKTVTLTIKSKDIKDPESFGLDLIEDPLEELLEEKGLGSLEGHEQQFDTTESIVEIYFEVNDEDGAKQVITDWLNQSDLLTGFSLN